MTELDTVLLSSLLADDKAIAVGVMYPGEDTPLGVPLIRVADIVDGRIRSTIGYRISEEVNSQYRRTQLSGDEVLMTLVGRPGIAIKVPTAMRGWNAARALAVIRLADPDERDFFVYSVASPQVQHTIRNWCNTTVQATLNLKEIRALPIPWPDRSSRRAIAATLGALDDKIELNRRINETLDSMARALFRDWFVDFGPARAKMEGRPAYLSEDLWSHFPDRLDDENKPEGWDVGTMSDLFMLQRGFDLPSQDRRAGNYPILAASGPSGFHETHMVKGPGVTTGRSGILGRVFYIHGDFWPLNTSLWVKDYKLATPLYAYHFLSLIDLAGFNAGSAVPTLNRNHIHGLPAVLPPRELIAAFDRLADSLMRRHRQNEIENETLAQTRDLLLPRLMSGELQMKEFVDA